MPNENERPWYKSPAIMGPAIAAIIGVIGVIIAAYIGIIPFMGPELATIQGIVTDNDGKPVKGAVVEIDGLSVTTGGDGRYVLHGVPTNPKTITVRAPGAEIVKRALRIPKGEEIITYDISLPSPTPTPIPTPIITPTLTPSPTPTPTLPTPNNPPVAFVDSINPNPSLQGQPVTFTCHGEDPDSGDYITKYRWESSIDGFLSDQKTFSTSSLTSGSHQIILRVKDSQGEWSSEITRNLKVEAIKIPSAEIKDIWFEHNVWEDYSYGMKIHVSFDIENLKGEDCIAVAYFYFGEGGPLSDFNQQYCIDGKVASWTDFEPGYVYTDFTYLSIFLPYDELHMEPGTYNLKFYISIWYEDTELDRSDWVYFPFTKSW